MRKHSRIKRKRGQTLITLLIFIVVAVTITTSATIMILNSSLSASKVEVGTTALSIAESGIDDSMIRLLRDPTYTTAGTTLNVGQGTATIVVTGTTTKTITSTGKMNNSVRKIQVTAGNSNGLLVITPPWQEIP